MLTGKTQGSTTALMTRMKLTFIPLKGMNNWFSFAHSVKRFMVVWEKVEIVTLH